MSKPPAARKRIHLVCNAHLDPVWLWHWEDGLAEACSTFHIAAEFCEQHPDFVFNHNESLLYQWIERFEPALFARIRRLVAQGRWHIAGGAYLQPDLNATSGESHIRHYLLARHWFDDQFGARPHVAYNFDPFGHPEGLPQILAGCGMRAYIFCRPDHGTYDLPLGSFRWHDRSGSSVIARRSDDSYLTRDDVVSKLERFTAHYAEEEASMILWGIGNHGGGVSAAALEQIETYAAAHDEYDWLHSTPENFFAEILERADQLPVVGGEIQNSFPGCYTSMSRVKRGHRAAESMMTAVERLSALAWWLGRQDYPARDLEVAWKDILFAEFHDVLPGSGVASVEQDSLQLLAHAQEILRRVRARTFFALTADDPAAAEGVVPIFVANPHGFPLRRQVELEYQLAHIPMPRDQALIELHCNGRPLPFQRIKAEHNIGFDWRVRLAVDCELRPWELARIEASVSLSPEPQPQTLPELPATGPLRVSTRSLEVAIDTASGLIGSITPATGGESYVGAGAFQPVLFADLDHSWTCGDPAGVEGSVWSTAPGWTAPESRFQLATAQEAAALSPQPAPGVDQARQALRIVEDGPLRMVIEAVFTCGSSAIVRHYVLGKRDDLLQVRDRVLFNHKDRMLKLLVPTGFAVHRGRAEACYSATDRAPSERHEDRPNLRWVAAEGADGRFLAICNDGSHGHSLTASELGLNVLRAPPYASFGLGADDPWVNQRFIPRQDQGEHQMVFEVVVGPTWDERQVTETAAVLNVPPPWQVRFPHPSMPDSQRREALAECIRVEPAAVQVVAVKRAERGEALIVRLQELDGGTQQLHLQLGSDGDELSCSIGAHALLTLRIERDPAGLRWRTVDLVEDG